jgi:hypothetical protein
MDIHGNLKAIVKGNSTSSLIVSVLTWPPSNTTPSLISVGYIVEGVENGSLSKAQIKELTYLLRRGAEILEHMEAG